jgi:hypothetical protein
MKKLGLTLILIPLFAFGTVVKAQELGDGFLGLPGDNLNLYAVFELFQESTYEFPTHELINVTSPRLYIYFSIIVPTIFSTGTSCLPLRE